MNCHPLVTKDSEKLAPIRESAASGRARRWIRVHTLPDDAYFPQNMHVAIAPADTWALVAYVRELQRKRLASALGAPAGID